jgi:hypothetical protein
MTTKREAILAAATAAIDATNPAGTSVFRNRNDAYASGQDIAIVVRPVTDQPTFDTGALGPINSVLVFTVDVISTGSQSAADDVAEAAYAALMAGIAGTMDITPGAHTWDMDGGSEDAIILSMQFDVMYRHDWGSLST